MDQDLFGFHTELFRTDCNRKRSQIQTKRTYVASFEQLEPVWLVVKDNFRKRDCKILLQNVLLKILFKILLTNIDVSQWLTMTSFFIVMCAKTSCGLAIS